eukprot:11742023-Alexandrium_andersonii.AAC.1
MSASLVGSEMCIRDSCCAWPWMPDALECHCPNADQPPMLSRAVQDWRPTGQAQGRGQRPWVGQRSHHALRQGWQVALGVAW